MHNYHDFHIYIYIYSDCFLSKVTAESVLMSAGCRTCQFKFPLRALRHHEANCSAEGVLVSRSQRNEAGIVRNGIHEFVLCYNYNE